MSRKIEEFKEYIKQHPEVREIIQSKNKTWQNLFEEWSLLGNIESGSNNSKDGEGEIKKTTIPVSKEMAQIGDMVKTCVNYVKKINPDNISKTVTNVQKLMALVAGIGAANTAKAAKGNKMTGDPLFDKKFDDWY